MDTKTSLRRRANPRANVIFVILFAGQPYSEAQRQLVGTGQRESTFSNSLIIHAEGTKETTPVKKLWICDPNYYKIRWIFALNFSSNYQCFEKLYQTLERAFHQISKHKMVLGSNLHRGQMTKPTFRARALRQSRRRPKAPYAIFVTSSRWKFEHYQLVSCLVSMSYSPLQHGITIISLQNKPFICLAVSVCLSVKGISFWRNCGAASKIWFVNGVDNVNWPPYRDWKSWRFER